MKILLINAGRGYAFISPSKSKIKSTQTAFVPPLGLLYIASSLENDGHSVEVIDYFCEKDIEKKMHSSLSSTDFVGLSVYTKNRIDAVEIANSIKKDYPNIPIIIGGPHCLFYPLKALEEISAADFCIEGEGEHIISYLIDAIEKNKPFSDIPGLYYRKNNIIKKGGPLKVIDDLDSISFPARHLVEKYTYGRVNKSQFYKPKFTSMISSRGCPYQCRFCTRHVSSMENYRKRSVKNVLDELKLIDELYSSVMISDDNFLGDRKWALKILDGIIESGIDLELIIQGARVDTADKDLYTKMRKAGVKQVYYGIESGCQEVLDFYNKRISVDQIKYAVNLAHKMNFFTLGTFIIGSPIETKDDIERTIRFACSLPLNMMVISPLGYEKGSDLWIKAVEDGKITDLDKYFLIANKKYGLSQFTEKELISFCKSAYKSFYFRFSYLFRYITSSIIRGDIRLFKAGLDIML